MTPDKLPKEIQEDIVLSAKAFAAGMWSGISKHDANQRIYVASVWEAGATAWAGWKVKHDEARKQADDLWKETKVALVQLDKANKEAQCMADALEQIAKEANNSPEDTWADIAIRMKRIAIIQLQQFKDGKGKEVDASIEKGQTFEYEIRHINNCNSEIKVIDEMAGKGYRLVAVSPYCGGNSMYFERMKQQADEPGSLTNPK